jgi:hypothetical protein
MAKIKMNKAWIVTIVVIIVAVILQYITYNQYSKLNQAVLRFNQGVQAAKTTKQVQDAYNKFQLESAPLLQLSESNAGYAIGGG